MQIHLSSANSYDTDNNSQWLKETKAFEWDCKHYLFVGERSYIEVLAKDYSWDSMGQVSW